MEASSLDEMDLCGFYDSWGIWCPWLDDVKRWYSDGRFSDEL